MPHPETHFGTEFKTQAENPNLSPTRTPPETQHAARDLVLQPLPVAGRRSRAPHTWPEKRLYHKACGDYRTVN
jgi:hypothetical protein